LRCCERQLSETKAYGCAACPETNLYVMYRRANDQRGALSDGLHQIMGPETAISDKDEMPFG
jgi:queuine/archaeosine tRNA-ribosyltransferase